VCHFRIFDCPVYIHAPVEKRTKLEPFSRKGLFVGYCETSKAYRVYIPEQRKIVVSRDVKFEEDFASRKSHEPIPVIEDEEHEASKVEPWSPKTQTISSSGRKTSGEEETLAPSSFISRPPWFTQTLRDAQEYVGAPWRTFRESRPLKKFPTYMALMRNIIDFEPSSFHEATYQQVWQDVMVEEYTSIMKNVVWDIVPIPDGKSVVTSRWLYKIKHVADGNIKTFKVRFVARGFSQKDLCPSCIHGLETTSDGCKDNLSQW
jgi:hypothetical protein